MYLIKINGGFYAGIEKGDIVRVAPKNNREAAVLFPTRSEANAARLYLVSYTFATNVEIEKA